MKIVAIEHIRCNEFDCLTYYVCDDSLTRVEIEKLVTEAQEEYLSALGKLETLLNLPPAPNTNLLSVQKDDGMDGVTIGEVRAQYNEWQKVWNARVSMLTNEQNKFEPYLLKRGFKSLYEAGKHNIASLNWGHQHGKHIKYKEDQ